MAVSVVENLTDRHFAAPGTTRRGLERTHVSPPFLTERELLTVNCQRGSPPAAFGENGFPPRRWLRVANARRM